MEVAFTSASERNLSSSWYSGCYWGFLSVLLCSKRHINYFRLGSCIPKRHGWTASAPSWSLCQVHCPAKWEEIQLDGSGPKPVHSIKLLKEGNGPKGLYGQAEDNAVIELSRAEVLRVIDEFEYASTHTTQLESIEHPESSTSEQQGFSANSTVFWILWIKEPNTGNTFASIPESQWEQKMNSLSFFLMC